MLRRSLILVFALLAVALMGCSPEASRARGSGPGADVGNRGATIDIHGPTNPAYLEPPIGRAVPR